MIDSSTMVVYGGYSQECEDYCDDVWAFNFDTLEWKRVSVSSEPGKRWKFSMVSVVRDSEVDEKNRIIVFGGHRLWHGFASDNSQENRWESTESYPEGGYLNDLWFLEKQSRNDIENITETWMWTKVDPKESCIPAPGIAWKDRNNVRCEVYWPQKRAGHAATFDKERNRVWIHGGYSVHYPYPSSTASGSGIGVKGLREKGFIPFGSQSYFLDDLWYFDILKGIWTRIKPSKFRDEP